MSAVELSRVEYDAATILEVSDYAPCGRLSRADAERYVVDTRKCPGYLKLFLTGMRGERAEEIIRTRWEESELTHGLWLAIRVFAVLLAEREETRHERAKSAASSASPPNTKTGT